MIKATNITKEVPINEIKSISIETCQINTGITKNSKTTTKSVRIKMPMYLPVYIPLYYNLPASQLFQIHVNFTIRYSR